MARFTDDEQACIGRKVRKLLSEGYERDQAVAIAIKHCAPEKSTSRADLDVAVDATPSPSASRPYRAVRQPDGRWTVLDVEVSEPFRVLGTDGEEHEIDGEWLRQALENVARDVRGGYRPPLNLRHRHIAPGANTTGQPPVPIGSWVPRGMRTVEYRGEPVPVAVVDLVDLDEDTLERIERGEIKARSIEVMPSALPPDGEPYIHAIALLDVEPPAFKARALRVTRVADDERPRVEASLARARAAAWRRGAWLAVDGPVAGAVARSAGGGGVEYAAPWRRRSVVRTGGMTMADPKARMDDAKGDVYADEEDRKQDGEARMDDGEPEVGLEEVQDGLEKAKQLRALLDKLCEVFGLKVVPIAEGDGEAKEEREKSDAELVAEGEPAAAEIPAMQRSDAGGTNHELLGRLAAMEAWKRQQEREAAIARAVDQTASDLARYGFDDREKLLAVARNDGLKALERFADGVRAYGVLVPPSQWAGELPSGVIGASDEARALAQRYQDQGTDAVARAEHYARKWDRCPEDYKRRVPRDVWVAAQMRHDGFTAPVART